VGTTAAIYSVEASNGVHVMGAGGDGDALKIGADAGNSERMGLTLEAGQQLLNLDLNFRSTNHVMANRGAAVRLDSRSTLPAIQFFTRPAGSATELMPMWIDEIGEVGVGPFPGNPAVFQVSDPPGSPDLEVAYFGATSVPTALSAEALAGSGSGVAVLGTAHSTSGIALQAQAVASTGGTYGVLSYNYSNAGVALYGNENANNGTTYGAYIQDYSTAGTALFADTTATSGTTYAVYGIGHSPSGYAGYFDCPGADAVYVNNSGNGRGVHINTASDTALWAVASNAFAGIDGRNGSTTGRAIYALNSATTGFSYGVYAQSSSTTGTAVYAIATGTGSSYGVYGASQAGASGYGVFASGNLGSNGVKTFRIDHPSDPAHKYLLHYSTESPEVLNAYSGKVTLNEQGEATVDLPVYFARINKDPRYTLTAVGAPMPLLHVAAEISEEALEQGGKAGPEEPVAACSFRIGGGAAGGKVCWRVEAVRNDRWVQAHGAPVELDKQAPEDGTYEHPELYGQPPEKASRPAELPPDLASPAGR
jgi:hypothetical protein